MTTRQTFEQSVVQKFKGLKVTRRPHTEFSNGQTHELVLYYQNEVHVATWSVSEEKGWFVEA